LVFLGVGFIGGVLQGNPVAITILVVLLLITGLVIFVKVRKGRRATAAKQRTVQLHIPIMSNDTVDSLTVRIMEHYSAQGAKITVAAAKAQAATALTRHRL
ncbi:MAG TPA: hypothetical protein VHS28_03735, partial [Chloroflexota bacterium]|nr:hypothetical protein [Chloroflexota bacterium]